MCADFINCSGLQIFCHAAGFGFKGLWKVNITKIFSRFKLLYIVGKPMGLMRLPLMHVVFTSNNRSQPKYLIHQAFCKGIV